MTMQVHKTDVNRDGKSLDEWIPPQDAEPFIHASINFCDEMDTHNAILDFDATITGTTGISDHALDQLKDHNFDTYWQAVSAVADANQYFEAELSDAVIVDSYILNMNKPQDLKISPYTPNPNCWKAWTLKGKLQSSDSWITLETVSANTIKFYRGTFTSGSYKYFRIESISAYDDVSQSNRIDAYLYIFGLYNSETKFNDTFPDSLRGRNDVNSSAENTNFIEYDIYINSLSWIMGDIHAMNGEIQRYIENIVDARHRHIGGIWSEFGIEPICIDYPQLIKFSRLNSLDYTSETGICLYMFPPPNEIWYFVSSGYAFDETSANLNTSIFLKAPDDSHKVVPSYTTTREYCCYSTLGSRYVNTQSGTFKANQYYVAFSDPTNMQSQVKFDGQEGKGLISDMAGTALTSAATVVSNVNVARLKIGRIWRGHNASIVFNPPIKLDGNVATSLFEYKKGEKVIGSVFRYVLHGYKVPK